MAPEFASKDPAPTTEPEAAASRVTSGFVGSGLTPSEVLRAQHAVGNAAVMRLLAARRAPNELPRPGDGDSHPRGGLVSADDRTGGGAALTTAVLARAHRRRLLQRSTEDEGSPGHRPNLDVGDTGPGVTLLQRLLGVSAKGTFDGPTRAAVIALQESRPALRPATGGVGPLTWKVLDEANGSSAGGPPTGQVVVGETDLGAGTFTLASVGGVIIGGAPIAQGVVTIGGAPVAGGGEVTVFKEVVKAGAKALTDDVAGPARYLAPEAAKRGGASLAARGGLFVLGTLLVAGTIYFVATSISRVLEAPPTAELPPGGAPSAPAVDPDPSDPIGEPRDAGAPPAKAPPAPDTVPAEAPGLVDDAAECARQIRAKKSHDHHIFPQTLREEFSRIGMDIDEYTITMPWDEHIGAKGIHTVFDWNSHWHLFFEDVPSGKLTPAQQKRWEDKAKDEAMDLLRIAGMLWRKIHPYRKP
jgi:hypothetical protein